MDPLILLRRLGGPVFTLNPDLIERAEATPDTVVTLIGGNKYVICESLDELVELIREYRARILASAEAMTHNVSLLPDSGPSAVGNHGRVRALSTAGTPGHHPVVPIRRTET
jgi:flagellar protein FlbD